MSMKTSNPGKAGNRIRLACLFGRLYFAAAAGMLVFSLPVYAASEAHGTFSQNTYYTDEEVIYEVTVNASEPDITQIPPPKPPVDNLEFINVGQRTVKGAAQGKDLLVFVYRFKPIHSGAARVNEFNLYQENSTNDTAKYIPIKVTASKIEIIKRPWHRTAVFKRAFSLTLILILCGLAAAALIFLIRRQRKKSLTVPLSLEKETLISLERLLESSQEISLKTLAAGKKTFHDYLNRKYLSSAPAAGSADLIYQIERRKDLEAAERKKVKNILEKLDEVQFAGNSSSAGELRETFHQIRDFIRAKEVL